MNNKLILYNGPTSPFGRKVKIVSIVQKIDHIEVKDFGKEKEKEKIRDKLMEKKGLEKMKVRFFN